MKGLQKFAIIAMSSAMLAMGYNNSLASEMPKTSLMPDRDRVYLSNIKERDKPTDLEGMINQGSVLLNERIKGKLINPLAHEDAKITSLPTMNAKSMDTSSVGSDTFGVYAFDFWQYVDSMVFWEGIVPTPDVIDSAHRNGVPIYGTLFFNWSTSETDKATVRYFLEEDSMGSKSYPAARKLVEIADFYGFDGYFFNQETHMGSGNTYAESFRDFMVYANTYAKENYNKEITFAWYDSMANNGSRYNADSLNSNNDIFMRKTADGKIPAKEFFLNFNRGKSQIDTTVNRSKEIDRDPFDSYAGLELQRGDAYKTRYNRSALLDENGKPRVSIGLYETSTILGLADDPEDYHEEENKFWTGFSGDPTKEDDSNSRSGMSRFVGDKTPITSLPFNTFFNSGHGKSYFVEGKVSRNTGWNHRSIQNIMPTWRWWIKSNDNNKLMPRYDFDDAYNGGNSLAFEGNLANGTTNEVMLYSSDITINPYTKLKLAYKSMKGSNVSIGFTDDYNYNDNFTYYPLNNMTDEWVVEEFNLSDIANENIKAISLKFDGNGASDNFKFNLGQIAISDDLSPISNPTNFRVLDQLVHSARNAEAIVTFNRVDGAEIYEVYQNVDGKDIFITASSSNYIYLSKLYRGDQNKGTTQELKVIAVGKNGSKSQATPTEFDWGINIDDTEELPEEPLNVVLGAKVTKATSDSANMALTGTITSLTDKWWNEGKTGYIEIELTEARNIKRWVMEHAGAGGEAVDDGSMNARDYDLLYKINPEDEWTILKSVRGNRAHVTDLSFDNDVVAKYYKLDVLYGDNDTPWGGIRIYNRKMYEDKANPITTPIPMNYVSVRNIENDNYDINFAYVDKDTKIRIYEDNKKQKLLAEETTSEAGAFTLKNIKIEGKEGLIYYTTTFKDYGESPMFAAKFSQNQKEIANIVINSKPTKLKYLLGEELDLRGGNLTINYKDGSSEVVEMTNPNVSYEKIDIDSLGDKIIKLSFLETKVDDTFIVEYINDENIKIEEISIGKSPKTNYNIGEKLDLSNGSILVKYNTGDSKEILLTDPNVIVEGFDSSIAGSKDLTIKYEGFEIKLSYTVNERAINYQRLQQILSEVNLIREGEEYLNASKESREILDSIYEKGLNLVENASSQEEVDQMVIEIQKAINGLTKEVDEEADKEKLIYLVESIEEIVNNTQNYTKSSADRIIDIYNKALDLLDDPNATEEEIDAIYNRILATLTSLREENNKNINGNKSDINKLIKEAGKINTEIFTKESSNHLKEMLKDAEIVYKNKNTNLDELENAYLNLMESVLNLELKDKNYLNTIPLEVVTKLINSTKDAKDRAKDALKGKIYSEDEMKDIISFYILESFYK